MADEPSAKRVKLEPEGNNFNEYHVNFSQENLKSRILKFFCQKKSRQIEGSFALLSKNVNKLSRSFRFL